MPTVYVQQFDRAGEFFARTRYQFDTTTARRSGKLFPPAEVPAMYRLAVALLLSASVALAAPVPKAVKAKPTLEGTWEAVSMTAGGRDIIQGNTTVWVIRGDTLVRNSRQGDGTLVPSNPNTPIEFKANPERPGEIDYNDRSGGGGGSLFRALFEVTADEFTIGFADLNAERPKELKEGLPYFYKFKRVEDKK